MTKPPLSRLARRSLGQDVFAKDKQKGIKSQSLALDVPVVVNEKEISVVQAFEPTNATPEPVAGGKRGV